MSRLVASRVDRKSGGRPDAVGRWWTRLATLCLATSSAVVAQDPSPYRGLWVGQVTLGHVNEVSIPLDENNVPVSPDPNVPTPTADAAQIRLILHVDGTGRVRLLRDVAVLARVPVGSSSEAPVNLQKDSSALTYRGAAISRASDIALVTDERLYGEFPPQPALRIASAVFDFGEGRATEAVQAVADAAAAAAAASVAAGADEATARAAGKAAATVVTANAPVTTAFRQFLGTNLNATAVNVLAGPQPAATTKAAALRADALVIQGLSFFHDARSVEMVDAIVAAVAAAGADGGARTNAAQNTAAGFEDGGDEYSRFLAGKVVGDMIAGAADAAATAAIISNATPASLTTAVNGNAAVRAARAQAVTLDTDSAYADSRARDAVEVVIAAVLGSASAALPADAGTDAQIRTAAEEAGRTALAEGVARYAGPSDPPSADYDTFVKGTAFSGSPEVAATAAAAAAWLKRAEDPLMTQAQLETVARDAAIDALRGAESNAFGEAALAARRDLPLVGGFGPGLGDARFTYDIKTGDLPPLGSPALLGTIFCRPVIPRIPSATVAIPTTDSATTSPGSCAWTLILGPVGTWIGPGTVWTGSPAFTGRRSAVCTSPSDPTRTSA